MRLTAKLTRYERPGIGKELLGYVVLSLLLCIAHIMGNTAFIALCLLVFLLVVILSVEDGRVFTTLLYFLPWSPLLKIQAGDTSFYTIALMLVCLLALVKGAWKVHLYQLIIPAMLLGLTLVAKGIQGNSLSRSYLFFLFMLVLFPCLIREKLQEDSFQNMSLCFAVGIIVAAFSAQWAVRYANIAQFIKVYAWSNITRLSGYYSDPNFYSAQITACMAGLLLMLAHERRLVRQLTLVALLLVLLYCGLLSASKSFIVVLACEFLVWVPLLLERRSLARGRFGLLMGMLAALLVLLSSTAFQNILQMFDTRFSYDASWSQLTTGRTDVWVSYLREFVQNPALLWFGEGYSDVTLEALRYKASHNTIIQGIYQFGLFGFPLLVAWLGVETKDFVGSVGVKLDAKAVAVMLVGSILPWMALDFLFFDEFFLLPLYVVAGGCFYSSAAQGDAPYPSCETGQPKEAVGNTPVERLK